MTHITEGRKCLSIFDYVVMPLFRQDGRHVAQNATKASMLFSCRSKMHWRHVKSKLLVFFCVFDQPINHVSIYEYSGLDLGFVFSVYSQGGYLAHIRDMGDNLFVGDLVPDSATHFWIGM